MAAPVPPASSAPTQPTLSLSGRYDHRVDKKRRFVLPSTFRDHFPSGGYLQEWRGKCLTLFTRAGWDGWLDHNRTQFTARGHNASDLIGQLRSLAEMVEVDGQGRFVMPARFRELAPTDHPVTVTGQHDRVDIWLPDRFAAEQAVAGNLIELSMDDYENHAR